MVPRTDVEARRCTSSSLMSFKIMLVMEFGAWDTGTIPPYSKFSLSSHAALYQFRREKIPSCLSLPFLSHIVSELGP